MRIETEGFNKSVTIYLPQPIRNSAPAHKSWYLATHEAPSAIGEMTRGAADYISQIVQAATQDGGKNGGCHVVESSIAVKATFNGDSMTITVTAPPPASD